MTRPKSPYQATSQNGWPVLDLSETHLWKINEVAPQVRLEAGPGGFVLAHFALWFGEVVERIRGNVLDDWGYAIRPIRGGSSGFSNHASGTAMDLNALAHPLGSRHTFTDRQERLLSVRLKGKYGGHIRWGGHYRLRADEMHFELDSDRAVVRALAHRLAGTERGGRVRRLNPSVDLD